MSVGNRRARRQRRCQGKQQTNRRVQPRELHVVRERQIDVRALDVGPAVPPAIENAIVGLIDLAVLLGPEHRLDGRLHPWMHAGGHQACRHGLERAVGVADLVLEIAAQHR